MSPPPSLEQHSNVLGFHQDSGDFPHRGGGKRKGRVTDLPAAQIATRWTCFSPAAPGFLRRDLHDWDKGEERERGRQG